MGMRMGILDCRSLMSDPCMSHMSLDLIPRLGTVRYWDDSVIFSRKHQQYYEYLL